MNNTYINYLQRALDSISVVLKIPSPEQASEIGMTSTGSLQSEMPLEKSSRRSPLASAKSNKNKLRSKGKQK